jgi:hypothetical protein
MIKNGTFTKKLDSANLFDSTHPTIRKSTNELSPVFRSKCRTRNYRIVPTQVRRRQELFGKAVQIIFPRGQSDRVSSLSYTLISKLSYDAFLSIPEPRAHSTGHDTRPCTCSKVHPYTRPLWRQIVRMTPRCEARSDRVNSRYSLSGFKFNESAIDFNNFGAHFWTPFFSWGAELAADLP